MNILMMHNSYRMRGGEDESFDTECRMLRDAGHNVETIHVHNEQVDDRHKVAVALESVWSKNSYAIVDRQLREHHFDVVHVQNFFPLLSPSVYAAAKKNNVAVVQTLRNYRLLCPSVFLFREGRVCEDCVSKTFKYPSVLHGCYRNSRLGSLSVAAMCGVHSLLGTWEKNVDLYISLTDFARRKFIQAGFAAERIVTKGNCVYPDPGMGHGEGGFVLFVGRLSAEKGIGTLLSAWDRLKPASILKIVGEGPLSGELRARSRNIPTVEWLGPKSQSEVNNLMGAAKVTVFCSEWYETFGRVAIESFAKGTPVIASRIGALAEVVDHLRTGLLFEAGNADDLALQLGWCFDHAGAIDAMRQRARAEYERKYTAAVNCMRLTECYELAMELSESKKDAKTRSWKASSIQCIQSQTRISKQR
jgi:glycosyltransferase involved in cell wall biosynthesis